MQAIIPSQSPMVLAVSLRVLPPRRRIIHHFKSCKSFPATDTNGAILRLRPRRRPACLSVVSDSVRRHHGRCAFRRDLQQLRHATCGRFLRRRSVLRYRHRLLRRAYQHRRFAHRYDRQRPAHYHYPTRWRNCRCWRYDLLHRRGLRHSCTLLSVVRNSCGTKFRHRYPRRHLRHLQRSRYIYGHHERSRLLLRHRHQRYGQATSQLAPLAVGNGILLQITGQPVTQYVDVGASATYQVTAVSSLR